MTDATTSRHTPTPVPAWVRRWAEERPDAVALVVDAGDPTTVRTWAQLAERQETLAALLEARGVRPGDRVGCLLGNQPEFVETFLATARIGAVFVPLNLRMTADEVAVVVGNAEPTLVVTERSLHDLLAATTVPTLDVDAWDALPAVTPSSPLPTADDLVAILYTSGTTGDPKGAMYTHAAFGYTGLNQTVALDLTPDDRHLVVSPLAFTGGILTGVQPVLFSGGTILLEPSFDPARLLRRMKDEGATIFMAVPTMLSLLLTSPAFTPEAFQTIRYLGSGSAPAPLPLMEAYLEFGVRISHAYGLTEGGGLATQLDPAEAFDHLGSAGKACVTVELRIVGEGGIDQPAGEVGEIWQRGPSTMSGYWRNPQATARALTDGWVHTGDLGYLTSDGYLTVVGRIKDVIITGGMNVYPADVESVVLSHPAVAEAAVVGVPHEVYGETVEAVVVLKPGATLTIDELRPFVLERLADYKAPRLLRIVDALPRTASGKVLKSELRS